MDRNRVVNDDKVDVDVETEFQHNIDTDYDIQIAKATDWLIKKNSYNDR